MTGHGRRLLMTDRLVKPRGLHACGMPHDRFSSRKLPQAVRAQRPASACRRQAAGCGDGERAAAEASYAKDGREPRRSRKGTAQRTAVGHPSGLPRMTRPPACLVRNVRGGDRTRGAAAAGKEPATRPDWRPPGAYGAALRRAPGRGEGEMSSQLQRFYVLKADMRVMRLSRGVGERARVWNTAGKALAVYGVRLG